MKKRILTIMLAGLMFAIMNNSCSTATINSEDEEMSILTPKPGPEPRINGTRIFGIRPGSPFLFSFVTDN